MGTKQMIHWDDEIFNLDDPHVYSDLYYRRITDVRERLPAYQLRKNFVQAVLSNDIVILCGETGSGKTTQLHR